LTPISSAQNLPVGLTNPGTLIQGSAAVTVQFSLNANDLCSYYTIAVMVSGNYSMATPTWQDTQVTVCRAKAGSILSNPAAEISSTGSAGFIATTDTSRAKANFDVIYNKSGTNPQGKVKLVINSTRNRNGNVDGSMHTYVITSNAITSLNVTGTKADFAAKCNVDELVADPITGVITEVNLDGGAIMQLSLTGGTAQLLGVTVNKSKNVGGMWYSSNWDGKSATIDKLVMNVGGSDSPIRVAQ
jgi:hypothetical protein